MDNERTPGAIGSNDQLGPLVEAAGLLACIDDAYLARGDWRPMVQAFAEAVRAAERERLAALLDAEADRQEAGWKQYVASRQGGPATSLHAIPRAYAARIRGA